MAEATVAATGCYLKGKEIEVVSAEDQQDGGVLQASESARFEFEGQVVTIVKGQTKVAVGHPILKGRVHLFEPLAIDFPLPQHTSKTKVAR